MNPQKCLEDPCFFLGFNFWVLVKLVTLSKKGGGVRKKSNFECKNKSDMGEGGGKIYAISSRCFSGHHLPIFSAHPVTF